MRYRFNNNILADIGGRGKKAYKIGDILEVDRKDSREMMRYRCTLLPEIKEVIENIEIEEEIQSKKSKHAKKKVL